MKRLMIFFSLLGLGAMSQVQTIKVKKETVKKKILQAELPSHVTLCGMYRGDVRAADIFEDNRLKISFNTLDLKIKSFEIFFKVDGKVFVYGCINDTISKEVREKILLCDKRGKVFIDDIKVVSKNADTLYLNPITLRIIE